MTPAAAPQDIVVLEEHYADPVLDAYSKRVLPPPVRDLLLADCETRLARLDRLGIATEVLSLAPSGLQAVTGPEAAEMARGVNDRLAAFIGQAPGRFAGFAALPTSDPDAAAEELERTTQEFGLVGAMIHGPTGGVFLDDPAFEPIFARAEALGVPLYLHPSEILPEVRQSYFAPYDATHPMFLRAGWGYTIETGTHAMRLVLSGLFDRHPALRIILGHLGEGIPYLLDHIDEALARDTPMKNFRDVFTRHFHVTTSGFFSDAALDCCVAQMGADRVMFSIDAPYAPSEAGLAWLRSRPEDGRAALAAGNARRLLGLG